MKAIILFIGLFLTTTISCKSKEEWRSRSIYQLLTDGYDGTSDADFCISSNYQEGNYKYISTN